jgi:hypothetical protein
MLFEPSLPPVPLLRRGARRQRVTRTGGARRGQVQKLSGEVAESLYQEWTEQ